MSLYTDLPCSDCGRWVPRGHHLCFPRRIADEIAEQPVINYRVFALETQVQKLQARLESIAQLARVVVDDINKYACGDEHDSCNPDQDVMCFARQNLLEILRECGEQEAK